MVLELGSLDTVRGNRMTLADPLWGQRWPWRADGNRGGSGGTHRDREGPGVAQEVAPANSQGQRWLWRNSPGKEVAPTPLMRTEWP